MNQLIILAGGKGSRMQSNVPKVLTEAKGVPIIRRLLQNINPLFNRPIMVVGHAGDEVVSALGDVCEYVYQPEQLGTGHALLCVKEKFERKGYENLIVVPGDHPLLSENTLRQLLAIQKSEGAVISLAFVSVPNFEGNFSSFYNCGRIIRDSAGKVSGIVEVKDASEEQKKIQEINVSYYCFDASWLWENIEKLNDKNIAREYYLTDMVKIAFEQGEKIASFAIENSYEGLGVNDKQQLAVIEKYC